MLAGEATGEEKLSNESFYSLRLKEWSRQIPVIKLSTEWEKNILDLVPSELRKRHPIRVELTLREIRNIYENDMRNFAVASIIPKDEITDDDAAVTKKRSSQISVNDEFIISQAEQCCTISKQRASFANKYFLSHSITKHIIATANSSLPRVIVDLKDYRKTDLFEMPELQEAIMSSVKRCAITIENDYHGEIVRAILVHLRCATNVEKKKIGKLLNCATNLFAQQIVKIMMNTIDELIEELADYRRQSCPRLSFKLVWNEDRLLIDPAITQVYSMWHCLVDSIENIAHNLLSFQDAIESAEKAKNDRTRSRIKISLPEWYMKKSHEKIDKIMTKIVGPLEKYFESMVKQFGAVTSAEMKSNILELVSKNRNFDVYCINVKKLNKHYDKANEMIDSVEYDIGRLSQREAKIRLKEHIVKMRNILLNKILINHREYNEKICKEFQDLRDEMLNIPKEAKALFQLSETISYASRVFVDKLEMRVRKSIEMLSSVIEITSEMSEEHMNLNAKTINWLADIKPVFNKSNTLCEAMKSELEDELQRQINKLNIEIDGIIPQFQILDDMDDGTRVDEYAEHLAMLVDHLGDLDRQIERINYEERLFKFPETAFPSVEEIRGILMPVDSLNNLMCEWRRDHSVWLDGPFEYINAQDVSSKTLSYEEQFNQLNASLKAKIKVEMQSSAGKRPFKFSGVVDDPDPMQQPAPLKLCWQVLQDVEKFKDYLELIVCMCNLALCERHWEEMSVIYRGEESFRNEPSIDKFITPNAGTTLRKLIALDLNKDIAKYQVISIGANKELALGQRLDCMIVEWEAIDFNIIPIKSSPSALCEGGTPRLHDPSTFPNLDKIYILMEEHFVIIREMKVSYFVKPIASALRKFSLSLEIVGETIKQWLNLQEEWFDLEPVFRSTREELEQEQLHEAGKLFFQIYETLRIVEQDIIDNPKFKSIADKAANFLQTLQNAADKLEIVKETVSNYLKQVRSLYPRFYFLSDGQVVRILFEPILSKRVKLLLNNCFTGIRSARLGEAPDSAGVVSIIDENDETLSLLTNSLLQPSSNSSRVIDTTLSSFIDVEKAIKCAVRVSILKSFHDYEKKSHQIPNSILMATVCGLRLHWTCKCEEAFLSDDPSAELLSFHAKQSLLLDSMIKELRSKLLRKRRKKLVTLIIQVRQQQDITREITVNEKFTRRKLTRGDFNWKAQVRYYWREDDLEVAILDTRSSYGYEYSVYEKPIIETPLTDRCYRTVMEAHRNRLYSALFGPTASGKTQCIKSLARTLGVSLRVFNCHEKVINYTYIVNVFKGLLGCSPCWLCFKHLDLLTIKVQSVLAQQISDTSRILASTSSRSRVVEFQGTSLKLRDPHCCFVSCTASSIYPNKLNRASKPQNLTDSLRILFRPVAMIIPDRRRIVEVELFAEGFVDAAILSEKINLLENYAIDQLTSVGSYDFSTRTTKSVVKTACALKNRYPDDAEDALLLRAILDVHLPKLNRSDVLVFQNIVEDIFSGVDLAPPNYANLLSAVEQVRRIKSPTGRLYSLKIIQMFEMIFMRHAIIVVGPSLAGKSSIIDTLSASLSLLNEKNTARWPTVESVRINHISFSSEELFGRYEINRSGNINWKDGILTRNLRSFVDEEMERRCCWQWLILDGPLYTSFLDELSTLLDEKKTLFLPSGESIRMNDSMSVIIETTSIEKASPATISRCGVIYVDEETIGLKEHTKWWIAEHRSLFTIGDKNDENENEKKYLLFLESLLEWSLTNCLNFVDENSCISTARLSVMTNKNHMIVSVLRLFEMYLRDAMGEKSGSEAERAKCNVSQLFAWTQAAVVMAIVWGLGGALDRQSRIILDEFFTSIWRNNGNNGKTRVFPRPEMMKQYELFLPSEGLIQDHIYVFSGTGSWRHWSDVLKKVSGQWAMDSQAGQNYVPTIESIKCLNLLETHIKYRKPFVLLGETATGKTLYMRYLLKKKICQKTFFSNFITLTGKTNIGGHSGYRAQQMFLSKITKLKIGVYGPGNSRLSINFIDDLNISNSDNSEDEASLELIRQYYDNSEWYEVDSGGKIRLTNVMFLGALSQDWRNESRNENKSREARFFRHFNLYKIDRPSNESIFKIYSNILLSNLRMNLFNADVSGSVTSMVNATIEVYSSVRQKLKPIPSKFQYQFSLRDVSRVISGCSLIHKESVETKITLIRLWVHEALRVFADRIVDPDDADWLFATIRESVRAHFKDSFETVFDNLPKNETNELTRESFQQLIFSDFMQADLLDCDTGQARRYEEIVCSREALRNKAISCLKRYNEADDENEDGAKKLDIIILSGLLEHLLRISRVIGMPGGSLLMICFGGSGRRSLTALAAHLKGQRLQELSYRVTSGSLADLWRTDVKKACMSCIAGITGPATLVRDCTFFMTDRQICGASPAKILTDICTLMKTGQVPDLFTKVERDEIVERSRLLAQNGDRNLEISSLSVIDYFHKKCQEKLHFVLYFNRAGTNGSGSLTSPRPIVSAFVRGRGCDATTTTIFNSIVSHCSIDCYEFWPEEAFHEIATKYIGEIEIEKDVKSKAIVASKYFYDSIEKNWGFDEKKINDCAIEESKRRKSLSKSIPVAAYVHMVNLYGLLMSKRQYEIRISRKRYLSGLEKLESAGDEVREMKSILTSLRPQLELSAKETADTMKKIERENISVENATVQVKREEQVANKIAEVAGILKEECEADLAVAIPILEDAVAALNTLKPTDITLVKAMKNPPDTVKLVLAAVCVMLNVSPDRSVDPVTGKKSIDYWAPSKRILGDMNFLQNLKDYDKDNIPGSIMLVVNKTYMSDENFMPHIVAKASSAAEGLCKWVRAMVSYDEVAKVVAPKKEKLAAAEKECNASLEYLNEKRMSLAALNDKLAALNVVLEATLAKKYQLENQVENCTNKLIKAEGLITSLAGEKARWLKSAETLRESYDFLAGDILLSCGLVAFLGTMDANDRDFYIDHWKNHLRDLSIPNSADFYDFVNSLETEIRISSWHHFGLSNNKFSQGNAVIVNNSMLWPLFLDPENQANLWIRKMEAVNEIRVVKATNPQWLGEIKASLEDDVPILVENLEQSNYLETTAIDYLLLQLCPRYQHFSVANEKNEDRPTETAESKKHRRLPSKFRLYITSRLSLQEASFGPHIHKLMSVINFSLTDEALENRLLEIVVSREKPELQDKFDKLMSESATNKRLLREEEENILSILSSTSVNIVEDERAIETLDYSKNLSLEIMRREEVARAMNREMNEFRTTYCPLTKYCSALYETLTNLTNLNHMYRFSFDWFTRIYVRSIDESMKSIVLDKRLKYLKASFTETLHSSVRNALLDEHKLVYSFLLSIKTLVHSKKVTREEIKVFRETASFRFKNAESITLDNNKRITIGEQLSKALPNVFQHLPESLRADASAWQSYCQKNEASSLPIPWDNKLTEFQQLILVSGIKPERTISKIINIVENSLETRLDLLSQYNIARSYDESSCLIPLLFILPSYLEVYKIVDKWAKKIGYSSKVSRFSMGTSEDAESSIDCSIERARRHGGWILLENCHLATDQWLAKLEKICESLDPSNTVLSFRLWLTSYPSQRFPISILQNSIKIHWETPSDGVKESFLRYYQSEPLDDSNFYNTCPGKNKIFAKLVYALCFFHTVVRGREKFGKRGWNIPSYEFTDSDLKISIGQLRIFVDEINEEIPRNFDALTYLIGECYYGGRILDPLDRKLLNTILHDYCNPRIVEATSNYVFAIDREGQRYSVPNRSEYHDYMKHINNSIPIGDSPAQIFSLDDNAATLRDYDKATDFIQSLSLLYLDSPASASYSYGDTAINNRPTIIQDIRTKLLLTEKSREQQLDIVDAKEKYPVLYAEPLNALLIEEIEIYNNLIEIIRESIVDVERTYDEGVAPLFLTYAAVDRLVENFLDNKIPLGWICVTNENKHWSSQQGRQSLSQFIDYLPKRRDFLNYWIKTGHGEASFWLGGIVHCKKFMSVSRLMLARKCGITLSQLVIDYEILKIVKLLPWDIRDADDCLHRTVDAPSSDSGKREEIAAIQIRGLFLSGARWDTERATLVESSPKIHWNRMPTIRLIPRFRSKTETMRIDDEDSESCRQRPRYSCPVKASGTTNTNLHFFGSLSTDYIATVPLDSQDVPPEYWIKRTTALFCNKDE